MDLTHQIRQDGTARMKWLLAQIGAIEVHQIEYEKQDFRSAPSIERVLKRVKVGHARGIEHDGLGVQPRIIDGEPIKCHEEFGQAVGPIVPVAGKNSRCPVLDSTQHPIAVELYLIGPSPSVGARLASVASCGSMSDGIVPGGSSTARLGAFRLGEFQRPAMKIKPLLWGCRASPSGATIRVGRGAAKSVGPQTTPLNARSRLRRSHGRGRTCSEAGMIGAKVNAEQSLAVPADDGFLSDISSAAARFIAKQGSQLCFHAVEIHSLAISLKLEFCAR
jgi:hypothetical protein